MHMASKTRFRICTRFSLLHVRGCVNAWNCAARRMCARTNPPLMQIPQIHVYVCVCMWFITTGAICTTTLGHFAYLRTRSFNQMYRPHTISRACLVNPKGTTNQGDRCEIINGIARPYRERERDEEFSQIITQTWICIHIHTVGDFITACNFLTRGCARAYSLVIFVTIT